MTAALALLLAQATPRFALVVGVDAYPWISQRDSPNLRLCAATNDVAAIGGLLQDAGFKTTPLTQAKATRAAVLKELDALAAKADKGVDLCFYFSGRGGVSAGRPTLVPVDAQETKPTLDVPMAKVEEMAKKATDKGAHVTIIVDASFDYDGLADRDALESRVYKPERKSAKRSGSRVQGALYQGPGAFLCPAQSGGAAYEWRPSASDTSWVSVFTNYLAGAGDQAILTRKMPVVRTMMREADAFFRARVRSTYLRGFSVALPSTASDPAYDAPFLIAGDLPPLPPERERLAKAQLEALRVQRQTLRVALKVDEKAVPNEAARAALRAKFFEFKAPLESGIKGVKLADPYDAPIDRVVLVTPENGLTLTVQGGPLTKRANPAFSGANAAEIVAAGLGNSLRKDLLVKRLWNAADGATLAWEPAMVSGTIAPGQPVAFRFNNDKSGYVFALTRDEGEAEIDLAFPNVREEDAYFAPGEHQAPAFFKNLPTSTKGRSDYLIVFVPAEKGDLPALPKYAGGGAVAGSRAFEGPLAEHLEALLKRLEASGVVFGAKRLEYEIP